MSKSTSNPKVRPAIYKDAFGFERPEIVEAIANIDKIKNTMKALTETDQRKIFYKLPVSYANKVAEVLRAQAGVLVEQYYARNRKEPLTVTNEWHKGDATDGSRLTHEIKHSPIDSRGYVKFQGIRPSDEVESFHFLIKYDDRIEAYVLPKRKLGSLSLYDSRNHKGQKTLAFKVGGPAHRDLRKMSTVEVIDDSTTGRRFDSLQFLAEAGITEADLSNTVNVSRTVRQNVAGTNTTRDLTIDELRDVQPLVPGQKFGLMIQDWLNDHLETATARIPGIGDGVGRDGTHEVKYSRKSVQGQFTLQGVKPDEFDDLYLALDNGEQIEFFKLTRRSAQFFVNAYGRETNSRTGISMAQFKPNGRAMKYLRRKKDRTLNLDLH